MSKTYGVDPNISGRVSALKARKMLLETQIREELNRPKPSNDVLNPLKQTKLHIKQEMNKIKEA